MTLDIVTQVLLCAIIFVSGLITGMLIAYREVKSRYSDEVIFTKKVNKK